MMAGHAHSHGHNHAHGHSHRHANHNRAFAVGIVLNSAFVVVEAAFGVLSGSMALIADAGHNLSDVLSLLLAWGASWLAQQPPGPRYTYGYKSSTILASLANAGLLLVALGAILFETINRLQYPAPVEGMTMIWVAGIGILINTATALMFMRGRKSDLNIRGAFLHMTADALVSVGVVVAGVAILYTGAVWIDAVTTLIIVAIIGVGTWGLLRDSMKMALHAVPENIDEGEVRAYLASLPGVDTVHDLHIWPMSTTETALTAHMVMPAGHPGDAFLREIAHTLEQRFSIEHTTLQVEGGAEDCAVCS
jgi:cobalt-zinc-cadmium efflux system protein